MQLLSPAEQSMDRACTNKNTPTRDTEEEVRSAGLKSRERAREQSVLTKAVDDLELTEGFSMNNLARAPATAAIFRLRRMTVNCITAWTIGRSH